LNPSPEQIEALILHLLEQRKVGATICPSEVARQLSSTDWRPLMPVVRDVARQMTATGVIEITQGGGVIDPEEIRGPIRLRLAPADEST
jgi:hypothetical protein